MRGHEVDVLNDLRFAFRSLSRSPGYSALAIVTLALGIGAGTAIFSVVNGVLLRPLPYPKPDSVLQVETVFERGNSGAVSFPDFEDLREQNVSFAEMSAYAAWTTTATATGEGFRVAWANVSPGFFPVMGVAPEIGRPFDPDEERVGQHVAVVSYGYWLGRLGGNADLANQRVSVGDQAYSVIGVMPRSYDFPPGTELWVPREPVIENRTAHNWRVVGRLREGVSPSSAQRDLTAIAQRLRQQYGDDTDMVDASARPILDQLVGNVRPALLVLLGAAGVLLLVACVNVANLMLARALSRDRESALRLALGARATRLARGYLAESLVLSLAGAGLGVIIALTGVPALLALDSVRLPRVENIGADWAVLAFALACSVLSAMTIGLVPAIRAAGRDMRQSLGDSHRVHTSGPANRQVRGVLVVTQIALTVVLLIGAGLLGRSLEKILSVDPGFRTDDMAIMEVWFPTTQNALPKDGDARIAGYIEELVTRLRTVPGVEDVGGINGFPLEGGGPNGTFIVQQRPDEVSDIEDLMRLFDESSRTGNAEFRVASAGYFETMGIPLVRGRIFDRGDVGDSPHVAVISASLAETRWPGEDPLGKLIQFGGMDGDLRPFTVVGIVGDVREYGIGVPPRPTFYADFRQRPRQASYFNVGIRGSADPATLIGEARRLARELDPEIPAAFKTLRDVLSASLADRQFVLLLITLFGAVALILAATGVYGVVAHMALQRRPEIGVRVAVGAQARDVVRLFVGQGAIFASAGVAIGLVMAFASARVLARFLYEVGAADLLTYMAVAVGVLTVATVASWIPAHGVSLSDPVAALRNE